METYLRFHGIPEQTDEVIRTRMVEILAQYMNQEPEGVEAKTDLVYRVRSFYAEKKNLPKDVIVQFTTKNMKEDIMKEHFQNPLKVEGEKIIVMNVIPRKMVQDRKIFKTQFIF